MFFQYSSWNDIKNICRHNTKILCQHFNWCATCRDTKSIHQPFYANIIQKHTILINKAL